MGVFLWIQFSLKWKSLFMSQVSQIIKRGSHLYEANCNLFSPPGPFTLGLLLHHHFFLSGPINLRHRSFSRFDDFKVSTRDTISVLQRTSGNLGSVNIFWSMAALNTLKSAASLDAKISGANGLFVTLWSLYEPFCSFCRKHWW